ncbi:uncharacterized protein C3orf22 homolog isoform X2 [Suricata suricatta]|uniref:Uncharacterized protein n=1 Tax=Suricata suricatta TaxID=37032 RepID=A0A673UIG8_SURSU|nr:uncharacterized protein C3orf22 homolog isoform X2 [Suricata suricatta]
MSSKDPKKRSQDEKSRTTIQEKFTSTFPYRFSWLTDPSAQLPEPWEATKADPWLQGRLPLQKMLVPTRSIPVRGLGAPDFIPLSSFNPRPPPPPLSYLWEFKLLSHRFPRSGSGTPAAHTSRGLSWSPAPHGPLRHPVPGALGSSRRALPSGKR